MRRLLVFALLAARSAAAQDLPMVNAPAAACDNLKGLRLPDVRFTEVADVRDSVQRSDNVRVPHCRVAGIVGKGAAFVVMLPNRWNQRLLMGGNGGFAGTIVRGVFTASDQGYVTVSTNTGHEETPGGGARWALNDLERQLDYGHVAVHRVVEVAKVLSRNFYGSEPKFSYFRGCSNGGRQGLMEAQRYPADFDGIIAGAPSAHFTRTGASFMKNLKALFPDPSYFDKPILTQASLDLLSGRVLAACDLLDGVKDGILDDPRECRFSLSSIKACPKNLPAADCLTSAQRSAIAAIYAPAQDGGTVVYPGQPFGGEAGGWPDWITGRDTTLMREIGMPNAQAMFATEGAKYFIFGDSTWDYSRYRGSIVRDAKRMSNIADADNPDLTAFAARKGKLILWHGWADPALNPLATIEYYDKVMTRDPRATEHVRLFMAPGVLHCGGGEGPSTASWLPAVVDWVERSRAPEQVVATKLDESRKVIRSRPLCAYPRRAVYAGKGSTDEAANFVCKAP